MGWIATDAQPKVAVAVAATGPHAIAAAARHAERIDLTVGGEPERLRRAVDIARSAAGRRSASFGAHGVDEAVGVVEKPLQRAVSVSLYTSSSISRFM